jgi:methionyl-tRNA formyltransferase
MKILILSSYPRVDRFAYKQRILEGLLDRDHDVKIMYSGIRPKDYLKEARRRDLSDVAAKVVSRIKPSKGPQRESSEPSETLSAVAERRGVEVRNFDSLGSDDALSFIRSFDPEHGVNLSGLYIPGKTIDAVGGRIAGGHYGDLPRFRGRDTVRWPILLDHPTVVTHMYLARKYDTGDILLKSPIRVTPGMDIGAIRAACQDASAAGHLQVVDAFAEGTLRPQPQAQEDGSTFYEMGSFLRRKVDERLSRGSYSSEGVAP